MVAQLSEIDLFLDARYGEIVKYAKANPEGSLELPEFPVSLTLSCADVATMSKSELRAHILKEASQTIYLQGWDVKDEAQGESSSYLQRSISLANLLGQQGHRLLQILLPISALCSVLLAIAFVYFSRGFGKLIGLGVGFCAATLLSLLALWGASVFAKTAFTSQDDPFLHNLVELTLTLLSILQRNYFLFFSTSLALIALGFIANRLRSLRRPG